MTLYASDARGRQYRFDFNDTTFPTYVKRHIVWMSPAEFLRFAPMTHNGHIIMGGQPYHAANWIRKIELNIQKTGVIQTGNLDFNEKGQVVGHEGRHTAVACQLLGIKRIPVQILGARNASTFNPSKTAPQYPPSNLMGIQTLPLTSKWWVKR